MGDRAAVELRQKVLAVLRDGTLDDRALLAALERLAADGRRFPGFGHEWAPVLYERNRELFHAFVVAHFNAFAAWGYLDEKGDPFDPWKKDETRKPLERLLEQVERDGEVQLFRRLYPQAIGFLWRTPERWRNDVRTKFLAARSDADRRLVLEMFDLPGLELDEQSARAMYEAAPSLCAGFLVDHAPRQWPWIEQAAPWRALQRLAASRGDHELELRLFRRQATPEDWAERVRDVMRAHPDAARLIAELDRIHPELTPKNAADVYRELLEARGEAVMPYVTRHLDLRRGFWSDKPIGAEKLIRLAERRGWLQLWAAVIRSSTPDVFSTAVLKLLEARQQRGDAETRRRLMLLAGVGREVNLPGLGIAQVMPLTDAAAGALYGSFPDLIRTVYRVHVTPVRGRAYEPLTRAALEAGDDELIDWLASRVVTWVTFAGFGELPKEQTAIAELLSRHYEALLGDQRTFARRAGHVLSAVPPHAIWSYDALIKHNRLARLLFERRHEDYLVEPSVVRDLLESPQIFVNRLAYAILSVDSPAARAVGARNVDLLSAALLRKLHSQTRSVAIDALANAASSEEVARAVLPKAREALRLPDRRYPKEKLIGMIGAVLRRHPSLRNDREQPQVFQRQVRP